MARVIDNLLSGVVGSVVFYNRGDVQFARSKPKKRKKKRSPAELKVNNTFGTVSKYGTAMIKSMRESFLFSFRLETYNTLRGWMRNQYAAHVANAEWTLQAKPSLMCQVNPDADLRDFLGAGVMVADGGNGLINVTIPEMNPVNDLAVPPRCNKVNVKLIAVTSPFRHTAYPFNFAIENYVFDYVDAEMSEQTIVLDTKASTGDIAFAVVALEFGITDNVAGKYNLEKKWLPAAVIAMGKMR